MKVFWLSTSSGDVWNIMSSLDYLGQHEVRRFHYDQRWHEQSQQACMTNPQLRQQLHAGGWRVLGWPRERVAMDADMIRHAENFSPDLIIFTSAWEGLFCPLNETLAALNKIAPVVHMLHDGSDHPWWPQLLQFEADKCFATTVNIDGGMVWPGGRDWASQTQTDDPSNPGTPMMQNVVGPVIKGQSLLTPVDPRPYGDRFVPHSERMYPIGYAGNSGGTIRGYLVQILGRAIPSLVVRPREESPTTYQGYADLLRACRIVVNVPFSGSNTAKHVKGRVVETGFAGACLMEWRNDATRAWFQPRHSFWEYDGSGMWEAIQDCIESAQFLMARPRFAEEIAYEHWRRVRSEHSPEVFWGKVFAAAGVPKAAEQTLEAAAD